MLTEGMLVRDLLFYIIGFCFLVTVVIWILGYAILVRPLDKIFEDRHGIFERGIPLWSYVLRLTRYTFWIALQKYVRKDKPENRMYRHYDFRGNASKLQIALSYMYVICAFVILVLGAILYTHDIIFGLGPEEL